MLPFWKKDLNANISHLCDGMRNVSLILTALVLSVPHLTVYMEGFLIAASNLPGNIFTILVMDSTGGKALLCESHVFCLGFMWSWL